MATFTTPAGHCDACGAPANFIEREGTRLTCRDCARHEGLTLMGQAFAALEALGFAVALGQRAGLSDADLHAALKGILKRPHSDGSYPMGGEDVLGGDRPTDQPWLRSYVPLITPANGGK